MKIWLRSLVLGTILWMGTAAFGYDWLQVQHPQQNWRRGQGTIEEAVVAVHPRGMFMEFGLYLTFSARGLNFNAADQVEVQFNFALPEEAIVHDLWLWVGDEIMRAKIYDKWTASSIYEDIVDRRRDPAILFKRGQGQYELRIYPMSGTGTRRIKLTYLVPTHWLANAVTASLPTNLLQTSKFPLETFYMLYWPGSDWQNPRLVEFPDLPFKTRYDAEQGNFLRADIPTTAMNASLHLAIDSPLQEGVYLNAFDNGAEGFYQLAFLPSQALELPVSKKVAFLFDYDASKSTIAPSEVLTTTKTLLQEQFTAGDSFNLIFSRLNVLRAGDRWFSGDSAGIAAALANLGDDPLASYSNLPALLDNGIDFIQNHGNEGSLLLISNSDNLGNYTAANSLIDDLLNRMDPVFPIHVMDYVTRNIQYYYFGGRSYRGNEYFYDNLTRLTNGNYQLADAYNFSTTLSGAFQSLTGFINSFDLHTRLQSGFCYGRFDFGGEKQSVYLDRPLLQVGKFHGGFPFIVQASGIYQGEIFSRTLEIPDSQIGSADTLLEEVWAGSYIKSLEMEAQSNTVISEIIDFSLRERVLSLYTAFLALEPSDTVQPCLECYDETELITGIESETDVDADSLLQAYPNPFNTATTINIRLPAGYLSERETLSFKIFNILGQAVRTFSPPNLAEQREFRLVWDGRSDAGETVASGTYFFTVSTPTKRQVLKLQLVK